MANKSLKLFDECVAECVHLYSQEENCTSSFLRESKMYTPGTTANSQGAPTNINKSGVVPKVRILLEQVTL